MCFGSKTRNAAGEDTMRRYVKKTKGTPSSKRKMNRQKNKKHKCPQKKSEKDMDLSEHDINSDKDDISCLELRNITETHFRITWVTPEVSGKKLKMELDTGSALSVINATDCIKKNCFQKYHCRK